MSMMSMQQRGAVVLALTGAALALSSHSANAQGVTYSACYVPASGTIYRIKEPGLKQECGASDKNGNIEQHVEFSWSSGIQTAAAAAPGGGDGGGKQVDHGGLIGLSDDDHSQYLLAEGVRNSPNGFAVTGEPGLGPPITSGAGTRLLWYPGRAALRAGHVDGGAWDESNIGFTSAALGRNTIAAGTGSFAVGLGTTASGAFSIAQGYLATASGSAAIASGTYTVASGNSATAIGHGATASGHYSTAVGASTIASGELSMSLGTRASTNGKQGAFVYGDVTDGYVNAQADNQFVVRAKRFWFGSNNNVTATAGRYIETSTGGYLSSGGAWVSSSDVARKTRFEDVDGDAVLARLAAMPIRTWSYKAEGPVRHMGPTAQDFHAAFGLGDTDKAIAGVDADGVSLAAIQALEKRTARVRQLEQLIERQDARIRQLERAVQALVLEHATGSAH